MEPQAPLEQFEPAKELVLSDLETLKVVSDPMRIQVLELLVSAPMTVKQLAAEMGTTPTKLYYHINLLEEHGLVRVVGTRVVSGIIEKQYRVTAYSLRPDPAIFTSGAAREEGTLPMILSGLFERTQNDIERSAQAGLLDFNRLTESPSSVLMRTLLRLSPEQAEEFTSRLKALIMEYSPVKAEGELTHGLMLAFYPLARHSENQEDF